jgi:hypothetical protein
VVALSTAQDWAAPCKGHPGIRVRAISREERAAARAAASDPDTGAPPDAFGERLYLLAVAKNSERLAELLMLAREAATIADELVGRVKAGEAEMAEPAVRAVDLASRATTAVITEQRLGRVRAEAELKEEDPLAARALARFEAWLVRPHLEVAARAITAWPTAPGPIGTPDQVLDCLLNLPDDPSGFGGQSLALEVADHLSGRALGDRGKGRSAPPSSSRGSATTARGGGERKRSTAKTARRRA